MCLILFAIGEHPRYPLIIAANRDEFYGRQTAPAQFWPSAPEVLAGRDLEAGGTWMAVTRTGKISMVTNYRDPSRIDPMAPSRGHLVSDYVMSDTPPAEYVKAIKEKGNLYNGFNLLVGDPGEFYYYSNYSPDIQKVDRGCHGLSNHLLDSPWPKVSQGIGKMRRLLQSDVVTTESLMELMYDDQIAPDESLPITGIGLDLERVLSSMFIKSPGYGSRSTTVVVVDDLNNLHFTERVYDTASFDYTSRSFTLSLPLVKK